MTQCWSVIDGSITRMTQYMSVITLRQRTISQLLEIEYEANGKNMPGTERDKCGNKYPKVTKGGYSQVFVWRCG